MCGQTTARVHELLRKLTQATDNTDADVRVSAPPFNVMNHTQLQSSKNYNIPVFGQIPSVAVSVLSPEMIRTHRPSR